MYVDPVDISSNTGYVFTLKIFNKGGSFLITPPYTLIVGCVSGFTVLRPHENFVLWQNVTYLPGVKFLYPVLAPSTESPWCLVEEVRILNNETVEINDEGKLT